MEDESIQKPDSAGVKAHHNQPPKDELPEKHANEGNRGEQRGVGWPVWLLILLVVLLLASSIANLVVSQRAYESSQRQVKAIEQLALSIRAVQRSIVDLSRMMEQSPPEEEEPEDERDSSAMGDGSI